MKEKSHRSHIFSQRFHLNFKSVRIREIREGKKLCAIQIIEERKLSQISQIFTEIYFNFKSVKIRVIREGKKNLRNSDNR